MPRLILMRHAKSSWVPPVSRDHDRPLIRRGRLASALMGAWLREEGLEPGYALVSSAMRTRQTWEALGFNAPMEVRPSLYNSEAETILSVIRSASMVCPLMVICHQPGIQEAANRLLKDGFIDEFPTAKAVMIQFECEDWHAVNFGAGKLMAEAAPKQLV